MLVLGGMSALLAQENLPVTRVVLFTNGVAYVEHSGAVQGDANLSLSFKVSQINDLLKSLVLIDEGGTVDGVRYPSQEPLSRVLGSFSINLQGVSDIAGLLERLRGAEVTLSSPSAITGRIVGVESRQTAREGVAVSEFYVNLWTSTGLQSLPLRTVTAIQPTDPRLREEFQNALQLISQSRNDDKKTIEIGFRGRGRRNVRIGYITEAPVWKTSYRLDLGANKAYLQAWAIVENVTEQDWINVKLSLVSGRPNSFIQDLYSPVYSPRPVIRPQTAQNLAPLAPPAGMEADRNMVAESAPMSAPAPAPSTTRGREPAPLRLQDSGVTAQATGEISGELFQFTVANPVQLPRRQSALIPLFTGDIQAEKVSYYNPSRHANTFNAVLLTNSTNTDFPGGAFTVLEGGSYAGDALVENLPRQQKRILTYGIDLKLRVQSEETQESLITSVKIVQGVMSIQRRQSFTRLYRLANSGEGRRVLLLDHPIRGGSTLRQPAQFEQKTATDYRFRIDVPKTEGETFKVVEEMPVAENFTLLNFSRGQFLSYTSNQEISPRVREALQRAADIRGRIETLAQDIRELERQRNQVIANQQRTRDNLASVGRETSQGRRFLDQLMQQEDQIENFGKQINDKNESQKSTQQELERYLSTLNVE